VTRTAPRSDEQLFVETSQLDDELAEPAVDIGVVPQPDPKDYDPDPPPPQPELLTLTLNANNVPTLVLFERLYRRILVLTSPHEAAQIEASYQSTFPDPDYALLAISGLRIVIYPGQRLFMRQPAVVDIRVSVHVHPDLWPSVLALPERGSDG